MRLDVALGPADIEKINPGLLLGTTCVVFDVLRATSTIVTALASGACAVLTVATIEEAHALKTADPSRILGGERHGDPPSGFDRGNSPLEYISGVKDHEVVLTTTNGTWALSRCHGASMIYVASLLNLDATARKIYCCDDLLILCAGTFETPALEDHYAAGGLVSILRTAHAQGHLAELDLSDSALLVESLFKCHNSDGARECLASGRNGRVLIERGWGDQVDWCARFSIFDLLVVSDGLRCRRATSIWDDL